MKKILLASICLLTLTACSTTSQNKQENTPKQSQSQSKTKEEKTQTKTFSKKIDEHYTNSIKFFYTKDKIVSFQLIASQTISEENQKMSVEELTKFYSEYAQKNSMIENKETLKGLEIHVEISEDKKIASAIFDFDLSKIDQEQLIQSTGGSDGEQTVFNKLQDKPEEVFNFMREQGLTEE